MKLFPKGIMMRAMMILLVVGVMVGVAHAETDAQKIDRLEKENSELRQEVARVRQALAILQRRIQRDNDAAAAKKVEQAKPAPPPVKQFVGLESIKKAIPVELLGTDNAAKGPPFDAKKLNEWLAANVAGKGYVSDTFQFNGRVDAIEEKWIRTGPGAFYVNDDIGLFVHYYQQNGLIQWYIVPISEREQIAKLKPYVNVVASGVVRKAWVEDQDRYFSIIKIAVGQATIKPAK